ncbi:phosphopyruvate hydratase [Sinomonas humi]|uniref:Enolase n=1 Tax=Sinomonas humi TaxID=1338436 RepID=A0A0B2ATV4_9MICC|nr:enolase C-terminal domain-like protein [Sinomonas humi]KHL05319.1 enolase [Sinomonas humi]
MTTIASVHARQILDCKARPMVEVEVTTAGSHRGRGAAPTGQSVGMYESFVLRDNDPGEYRGLGVRKAVDNVNSVIAPALQGMDISDQSALDRAMIDLDGTPNKSKLGGNAIYSVSVACLRAAAAATGRPVYEHIARRELTTVPVPSFNVVNGGKNGTVYQAFNEFLIMPYKAETIGEAVEIGVEVFDRLSHVIEKRTGGPAAVARSYGYAAPSADPRAVMEILAEAVDACGYREKVAYALDCASSETYDSETKTYELAGKRVSSSELIEFTKNLTEEFDFVFIEDLLDENDWAGFSAAVRELKRTIILGDDLIVTNPAFLERAIRERAVDGFILKPNQVGTITEALATYDKAAAHGLLAVPSGRSGGVVDDIVMDLSLGLQVPFQKNGAPRSGERIEKLNFLMRAADLLRATRLADVQAIARF